MIDSLDNDQEQKDNRLAAFTDRALAAGQGVILPHSSDDPELAELEHTVMQLKSLIEADATSAVQQQTDAQNRIYPRLAQQWMQENSAAAPRPARAPQPNTQKARPGWLDQIRAALRPTPQLRLAYTLAAILLLAIVVANLPLGPSLTGAAGQGGDITWSVIIGISFAGALLVGWILLRRRH